MVLPALIVPAAIAVGSSVITGIASYFAFKSKESQSQDNTTTKGEIYNNVHLAVQENNNQNNMLVSLVAILVLLKIVEVIIYTVNSYKRTLKRKYNATQRVGQPMAQQPAVQPIAVHQVV